MLNIVNERIELGKKFMLNESICFINETLAYSYNLNSIQNTLKRMFPEIISIDLSDFSMYLTLAGKNKKEDKIDGENNGTFEIKLEKIDNVYKIAEFVEKAYGWHQSILTINDYALADFGHGYEMLDEPYQGYSLRTCWYLTKGTHRKFSLFMEANYSNRVFDIDSLYHLTNKSVLGKISRNGLGPRSHGNFPERIYFGTDINAILRMVGKSGMDATGVIPNKVLLKIDFNNHKDAIMSRYKFYQDPREKTSVYTYDVIDPKYIMVCTDDINRWLYQEADVDKEDLDSLTFKHI